MTKKIIFYNITAKKIVYLLTINLNNFQDKIYKDYMKSLKPILKRYAAEWEFNEPELFDLIDKLEQIKKDF